MKETELWELLVSLSAKEISLKETHDRILGLFNDVEQSEQCLHTERVWTIDPYDQKCFKCVKCGEYGV
jgi:hypothetical protein